MVWAPEIIVCPDLRHSLRWAHHPLSRDEVQLVTGYRQGQMIQSYPAVVLCKGYGLLPNLCGLARPSMEVEIRIWPSS
jgi:hypothetical protein